MLYKDKLEAPRLITRFVTQEDVPVWLEYCSDPVATEFTGLSDKTPEEMALEVMKITLKRYEEGRLGLQALISKETGEMIGKCGLLIQHEVNGKTELEIGYHLIRRYWGQGYAIEAAQMFRDYAFENDMADSVVSIIDPLNIASQKVALRNGRSWWIRKLPSEIIFITCTG
ncbi:MAG: GNAT family N-acetyltransferase [Flavipsychrobacter sp.]